MRKQITPEGQPYIVLAIDEVTRMREADLIDMIPHGGKDWPFIDGAAMLVGPLDEADIRIALAEFPVEAPTSDWVLTNA